MTTLSYSFFMRTLMLRSFTGVPRSSSLPTTSDVLLEEVNKRDYSIFKASKAIRYHSRIYPEKNQSSSSRKMPAFKGKVDNPDR